MDVALRPVGERAVVREFGFVREVGPRERFVGGRRKVRDQPLDFLAGHRRRAALDCFPFGFDVAREHRWRAFLHQDLDARLVLVVAASVAVVDAQDRIQVVQDFRARQELANDVADDRRAAEATADDDAKADGAGRVTHCLQPDVVDEDSGAIGRRSRDRDLELARQEGEFRMECRPLADEFAPRARVDDLVGGRAGEMIAGDVAHAVAGRLDRVHLDGRELGEKVGNILELRPVELQVLPRREVAVAAVVLAADAREGAELLRRQHAVGHGNAQHRRVLLNVESVLQPQRPELVLCQVARQEPVRLVAKLGDPFRDNTLIEGVVPIHAQ